MLNRYDKVESFETMIHHDDCSSRCLSDLHHHVQMMTLVIYNLDLMIDQQQQLTTVRMLKFVLAQLENEFSFDFFFLLRFTFSISSNVHKNEEDFDQHVLFDLNMKRKCVEIRSVDISSDHLFFEYSRRKKKNEQKLEEIGILLLKKSNRFIQRTSKSTCRNDGCFF